MLMLDYLGWSEAAQLIDTGITGALQAKEVTYDFARLMEGSTEVSCSEFGDRIIAHMTH
jgi:isocitrate dehydrogenase